MRVRSVTIKRPGEAGTYSTGNNPTRTCETHARDGDGEGKRNREERDDREVENRVFGREEKV